MERMDELKHDYWDRFLTEFKEFCEKHRVILEGNEDGEVIVTDTDNSYETLNLGCCVSTKSIDNMLKS